MSRNVPRIWKMFISVKISKLLPHVGVKFLIQGFKFLEELSKIFLKCVALVGRPPIVPGIFKA